MTAKLNRVLELSAKVLDRQKELAPYMERFHELLALERELNELIGP